jgi:hypothetical protein
LVRRYDLWNDKVVEVSRSWSACNPDDFFCFGWNWEEKLADVNGSTMYVRDIPAGESYWWD